MPGIDKTNRLESHDVARIGVRLGSLVRQRRERRTVQDVADEVGISPFALARVEGGGLPNLSTFVKLCVCLRIDPSEILGISFKKSEVNTEFAEALREFGVHLSADQALPEAAASDLAQLIIFAHRELALRIREGLADASTKL